jgi:hypothetical protein
MELESELGRVKRESANVKMDGDLLEPVIDPPCFFTPIPLAIVPGAQRTTELLWTEMRGLL